MQSVVDAGVEVRPEIAPVAASLQQSWFVVPAVLLSAQLLFPVFWLVPLPSYQAALLLSVSATCCHAAVVLLLWAQFPRLLPVTALIFRSSLMKNMIL